MKELIYTIININEMFNIIISVEAIFGETILEDYNGTQFIMKVLEKQDKSIGFLFGFIEMMNQFAIKDYTANYTTLKNILNGFVNKQKVDKLKKTIKRSLTSHMNAQRYMNI